MSEVEQLKKRIDDSGKNGVETARVVEGLPRSGASALWFCRALTDLAKFEIWNDWSKRL